MRPIIVRNEGVPAPARRPSRPSITRSGHDAGVTRPPASLLERPVYGIVEAAGLLGLRSDRTRAWLDGYARGGVTYPPVIRFERTGADLVTWGEFVELGYLREYRRKGVPLQRLRPVIDALRREFDTPYPLATSRPYVYGKELILELQEHADLPAAIAIVVRSAQEVMLSEEAKRFVSKVEFDHAGDGTRAVSSPLAKRRRWSSTHLFASGDRRSAAWRPTDCGSSSMPANGSTRSLQAMNSICGMSAPRSPTRSSCAHWQRE